ncbi:MAG: hypothetical protein JXQ71_17820 [Verrucomicrobia bacterium]|nr:hypothetical protein [Verrucomicrobiota bacterium]
MKPLTLLLLASLTLATHAAERWDNLTARTDIGALGIGNFNNPAHQTRRLPDPKPRLVVLTDIGDQDGIADWMSRAFPGLNYTLSETPAGRDKREGTYRELNFLRPRNGAQKPVQGSSATPTQFVSD